MRSGDVTQNFSQELTRKDGGDKWMVAFAQTNDGHLIYHNDKAEWDTATIIHKDIISAAENKHIINERHWQIIRYTVKSTKYTLANCHLPWEDAVEELSHNLKQQEEEFARTCTIWAGDFNSEWPQWKNFLKIRKDTMAS